jgi:hypothetical protein
MSTPPPCTSLGRHCRDLKLIVRISDIRDDSQTLQEAASTWMTAHTERVTFGSPHVVGNQLLVEATVHVPCKYLKTRSHEHAVRPDGTHTSTGEQVQCAVHGFRGPLPRSTQLSPGERPQFYENGGPVSVIYKGSRRWMDLPLKRAARRSLPTIQNNPCVGAPCRTGDNTQGAACCRDLTLELHLPKTQHRLEALLRARKSPYLCKVKREDDDTMECEVITACGYLDDDGISCVLHDRVLPNGRIAKPSLCYEWPELEEDETGHTGCRLV